jgi:hypothetical protein
MLMFEFSNELVMLGVVLVVGYVIRLWTCKGKEVRLSFLGNSCLYL